MTFRETEGLQSECKYMSKCITETSRTILSQGALVGRIFPAFLHTAQNKKLEEQVAWFVGLCSYQLSVVGFHVGISSFEPHNHPMNYTHFKINTLRPTEMKAPTVTEPAVAESGFRPGPSQQSQWFPTHTLNPLEDLEDQVCPFILPL